MPDVNLLQNTQLPDDPRPRPKPSANPRLTEPTIEPKRSLGDTLRSLLGRRSVDPIAGPVEKVSLMSTSRGSSGQRILSDNTKSSQPLVPLPEDEDFNVNLLTEDVVGSFNPRLRFIQLGLGALGSAILVGLAFVGLAFYEKSIDTDVKTIKDQTAVYQEKVLKLEADMTEAESVNLRIQAVSQLIDKHVRWTRFFEKLEKYTLPEVTYGGTFSGTLTTQLTFSAKTDSFERLAQQYLVYKQAVAAQDFITEFSITSATRAIVDKQETVSFTVSLSLIPTMFDNPIVTKSPTTTPTP